MEALIGAYPWVADHQKGTAGSLIDEIICEGSDIEDGPLTKAERQKRREAIGLRYLQGHVPFIQSAQLKGPFDRKSGWINPWRSKQSVQKSPVTRTAATYRRSPVNDPSTAGMGKRQRNGSNSSINSIGIRAEALAECSATSIDIVDNRQPAHPNLYDGIKRFSPDGLGGTVDSAKRDERGNSLQQSRAGAKRRADTSWLRGADIGKRSRSELSELTSPTRKTRIRDILRSDEAITNLSRALNEQSKKQVDRLRTRAAASTSPNNTATPKRNLLHPLDSTRSLSGGIKQHSISKNAQHSEISGPLRSGSTSRDSFISRYGVASDKKTSTKSVYEKHTRDENGLDPTIEINRTALEHSFEVGSFDESFSGFAHKTLVAQFSSQTFEPSHIRTIPQDQLDQQTLYGLSQASQLAHAAETTEPHALLNMREPTPDVIERCLSDLENDDVRSLSEVKRLSLEAARSSSNSPMNATNHTYTPIKSSVALKGKSTNRQIKVGMPYRSLRTEKCFNGDSPLPPGSLKYRRVKRKVPPLLEGKQYHASGNATSNHHEILENDLHQSTGMQDHGSAVVIMSVDSRDTSGIDCAMQQSLIEPLAREWPKDLSTNGQVKNDDVEVTQLQPGDRISIEELPIPIVTPHIPPNITETDLTTTQKDTGDDFEPIDGDHVNIGSPGGAPLLHNQEHEEGNSQYDIAASKCPSLPKETTTQTPNNESLKHQEVDPLYQVTNITNLDLGDVTLSQDPDFRIAGNDPEPVIQKPVLRQEVRLDIVDELKDVEELDNIPTETAGDEFTPTDTDLGEYRGVVSGSSVVPDIVNMPHNANSSEHGHHVHVSNSDLISVAEEPAGQPEPQSPWAMEEIEPGPHIPQTLPPESTRHFSMSQSKDAAFLLVDTESGHGSDYPTSDGLPTQIDENCISKPTTPYIPTITLAPSIMTPSPKQLSQRTSPLAHFTRTQEPDSLSLANPWTNDSQRPTKALHAIKPKKRVSFSQPPCDDEYGDGDNVEEQPELPRQLSKSRSRSRDISSPPPPPGAEALTEGDDKFHRRLKATKDMITSSAHQERFMRVTGDMGNLPSSPGIDAMAEAFLAADAKIPSDGEMLGRKLPLNGDEAPARNIIAGSWNFDNLMEEEDEQPKAAPAPVVVMMTESQAINPWDDEDVDGLPPFSMAMSGQVAFGDDEEIVDDVLHDMSDILDGWDVDAELDRARREDRSAEIRKSTARERMGSVLRY